MFDIEDSTIIEFKSGSQKAYRAYCDKCGKDRGYLLKTVKNDKSLCRSCSKIIDLSSQYPNVDFTDYKLRNSGNKKRYVYRCYCKSCRIDRGYHRRSRWTTLCRSCTQKGKIKTLSEKIHQSCIKRNISISCFEDFIQPVSKKERLKFDTSNLSKSCFEINNYTCIKCQKRGGDLVSHHIYSWDKHVDKRFNINNLACLCKNCHKEFHKVFGYGSNTKTQFESFLTDISSVG